MPPRIDNPRPLKPVPTTLGVLEPAPGRPRTGTIFVQGDAFPVYGEPELRYEEMEYPEGLEPWVKAVSFYRNAWEKHRITLAVHAIIGFDRYPG